MKTFLLACCLGLSAVCGPLSAQVAPKATADAPLTPEEAKKLQVVMTKATASPEAKTAEENLRKAREELAKATQAYQTSVEKAAIDADPSAAPVIEKTRRLQQEALARRNTGKTVGNAAVASAPRQAPRVAAPSQVGQPIATARPTTGFPRPSELFDNWAAVGLLIALGVIAVLLLRKRG
ncbi:MAG: hypothetical protein RLZZ552_55 [Verrucomicrobiota bacterium]